MSGCRDGPQGARKDSIDFVLFRSLKAGAGFFWDLFSYGAVKNVLGLGAARLLPGLVTQWPTEGTGPAEGPNSL